MDQTETFEWLRQRSNQLDEVEAELQKVRAKLIECELERARLAVKPIVDREKQSEQVGELMNMQLDATTSRDDDLVHHVRRVLLYCSNFGDSVCICGDEQPKGTHDDECEDAQRLYERIATIRGGSG